MENSQVYLLKNVKKFLSKFKKKKFHPKYNSNLYFVTTTNYVGSYILKRLSKFNENFFSNIFWVISDFLGNLNYVAMLRVVNVYNPKLLFLNFLTQYRL